MKFIVTTTINSPTEAILRFSKMRDWQLVIVLDKKTPENFEVASAHILTVEKQEYLFPDVSELLGWNCIQRRNIGYLYALYMGATVIATVDDDNIPGNGWGENLILENANIKEFLCNQEVFDPISVTNHGNLWHRGYPLELVHERTIPSYTYNELEISIQADFWNGDPDIDAIAREIWKPECVFEDEVFPYTSNKVSPFNSQNTFLRRSVFPDYFLFPFVGRMDDIWASYYVQSKGFRVCYNKASVVQIRNQHTFYKDFENEIVGYLNNLQLVRSILQNPESIESYIPKRSYEAWMAYREAYASFETI